MLLYAVVLFFTPVLGEFLDTSVVPRVARSATIAGYLYAMSDLLMSYAHAWKREVTSCEKEIIAQREFYTKLLNLADRVITKYVHHYNSNRKTLSFHRRVKSVLLILRMKGLRNTCYRTTYYCTGKPRDLNYARRKEKMNYIMGSILFATGSVLFFITVLFDSFASLFHGSLDAFTIYGCALVMMNYLFNGLVDDVIKKRKTTHRKNAKKFAAKIEFLEQLEAFSSNTLDTKKS